MPIWFLGRAQLSIARCILSLDRSASTTLQQLIGFVLDFGFRLLALMSCSSDLWGCLGHESEGYDGLVTHQWPLWTCRYDFLIELSCPLQGVFCHWTVLLLPHCSNWLDLCWISDFDCLLWCHVLLTYEDVWWFGYPSMTSLNMPIWFLDRAQLSIARCSLSLDRSASTTLQQLTGFVLDFGFRLLALMSCSSDLWGCLGHESEGYDGLVSHQWPLWTCRYDFLIELSCPLQGVFCHWTVLLLPHCSNWLDLCWISDFDCLLWCHVLLTYEDVLGMNPRVMMVWFPINDLFEHADMISW